MERTFTRELLKVGADQAEVVARRLSILLDGAIMLSIVHHDSSYAAEAGQLAASLVRASRPNTDEDEALRTTACVSSSYATLRFEKRIGA
jgi:hypothetical protein